MSDIQVEYFRTLFSHNKDRVAIVDARNGNAVTYGTLMDQSLRLATALKVRGVSRGEQVVFSSDNSIELAILYLACMHIGAQIIPINPASHVRDFESVLRLNNARLVIVGPAVRLKLEELLKTRPADVLCFRASVEPEKAKYSGLTNFDFAEQLSCHQPANEPLKGAQDEDAFLVIMSSGTTGEPKGVEICYGGLLGNGREFGQRMDIGPHNRFYNVLPMTYLGGFYNLLLLPLVNSGSLVLDSAFGVPNMYGFWDCVKQHEIDTLWFTSTMLSMLLNIDDEEDFAFLQSQTKLALCGMAPLSVELKRRFESRFRITLYENYGLSETTFITTNHPGLAYKEGSVGLPLPGVKVSISGDDGKVLPANCEGQILAETPYLMCGYRNAPAADQANLLPGGGFRTGDVGYLDGDGELFITGRIKDLIIRGGVNISPKSVENVIYQLEGVEDVAVVGIPHAVYGEEVVAVVKLHDKCKGLLTADEIKTFCDKRISSFERPKSILLIDQMPLGPTGKIQKSVLRRLVQEKLDPLGPRV